MTSSCMVMDFRKFVSNKMIGPCMDREALAVPLLPLGNNITLDYSAFLYLSFYWEPSDVCVIMNFILS